MHNPQNPCPFLRIKDDPDTWAAYPSHINHCLHAWPVQKVAPLYQEHVCLTGAHVNCPVFKHEGLWPGKLPEPLRNDAAYEKLLKQHAAAPAPARTPDAAPVQPIDEPIDDIEESSEQRATSDEQPAASSQPEPIAAVIEDAAPSIEEAADVEEVEPEPIEAEPIAAVIEDAAPSIEEAPDIETFEPEPIEAEPEPVAEVMEDAAPSIEEALDVEAPEPEPIEAEPEAITEEALEVEMPEPEPEAIAEVIGDATPSIEEALEPEPIEQAAPSFEQPAPPIRTRTRRKKKPATKAQAPQAEQADPPVEAPAPIEVQFVRQPAEKRPAWQRAAAAGGIGLVAIIGIALMLMNNGAASPQPTATPSPEVPPTATIEPTATATPPSPTASIEPTALPTTPAPVGPQQARMRFDGNLRAGPGTEHAVLDEVLAGTTIMVIGRDLLGVWLVVELNSGQAGWLPAAQVNTDEINVLSAPILEATYAPITP